MFIIERINSKGEKLYFQYWDWAIVWDDKDKAMRFKSYKDALMVIEKIGLKCRVEEI